MDQTADIERVRRIVTLVRLAVARASEALERAKHPDLDHDTQAAIAMSRAAVARSRALLECPDGPAANRPAATRPQAEPDRQELPVR